MCRRPLSHRTHPLARGGWLPCPLNRGRTANHSNSPVGLFDQAACCRRFKPLSREATAWRCCPADQAQGMQPRQHLTPRTPRQGARGGSGGLACSASPCPWDDDGTRSRQPERHPPWSTQPHGYFTRQWRRTMRITSAISTLSQRLSSATADALNRSSFRSSSFTHRRRRWHSRLARLVVVLVLAWGLLWWSMAWPATLHTRDPAPTSRSTLQCGESYWEGAGRDGTPCPPTYQPYTG